MVRTNKPWGHEELWAHTDKYVGKFLVISAGQRLSLQHHDVKDETICVLEGRLRLELENTAGEIVTRELGPGESARIQPGRKHRFGAITDVRLAEVSTPELADVVRHEDDFGRD